VRRQAIRQARRGAPAGRWRRLILLPSRWRLHALALGIGLLAAWHAGAPLAAAPGLPQTEAPAPAPAPDLIQNPLPPPPAAPDPNAALQSPVLPIAATPPTMVPDEPCPPASPGPLPSEDDPAKRDFWNAFKAPLPPEPVWDPPGPPRVGLQVGHWQYAQRALELFDLDPGGQLNGVWEWEVGLDLAQRAKSLLEAAGVSVDLLDMTIPQDYRANAFLAIHADMASAVGRRGFKLARPGLSSVPTADDRYVTALGDAYAGATGMPRDDRNVDDAMRYYYAFNSRRYCLSVSPGVPQAILEAGYLSSAQDRAVLLDDPDIAARGIADGLLSFLGLRTPQTIQHGPPRVAQGRDEVLRGDPSQREIALVINVGAGFESATSVLDTLLQKEYTATFFVMGWWADKHTDLLARITANGHEVASHGYKVPELTQVSDEEVRTDLARADAAIAAVVGHSTRPLWSPSEGDRDARVDAIAASLGYRPILWTVDSGDWRQEATADGVYRQVMNSAVNGAIIVLHLDSPRSTTATAGALPRIIDQLRARGYKLVTVTELLTS
jgi:peptidoglycan/xylan/chitin deacetylase (PgdA/CDA1 family)